MRERRPQPKFAKNLQKKDISSQSVVQNSPKSGYKRGGGLSARQVT